MYFKIIQDKGGTFTQIWNVLMQTFTFHGNYKSLSGIILSSWPLFSTSDNECTRSSGSVSHSTPMPFLNSAFKRDSL